MIDSALASNDVKTGRTEGSQGTTPKLRAHSRSQLVEKAENTGNMLDAQRPNSTPPTELTEPDIQRPTFMVHDDWFKSGGVKREPGLYWHGALKNDDSSQPIDDWLCSPIHADAITASENEDSYGLLLRFVNPNGQWREWAAPMKLLSSGGDEVRRELLDMGVRINLSKQRQFMQWMMQAKPVPRIVAASRTGWYSESFVLPDRTIGDSNVRFQSERACKAAFKTLGSIEQWRQEVASKCSKNPLLILAMSTAFAGPLLKRAKLEEKGGAGVHLLGDSSRGKTTALRVAASVWSDPSFVNSWRATSNGIEATAASLNDTVLLLDEISECDPRDIGAIVYSLANGTGKQRADRSGGSREPAKWRVISLSSGERSLSAHMAEGGKRSKAGQEARFLDVPATSRTHGLFDELHGVATGSQYADEMKIATSGQYGHAGPTFIRCLLSDTQDLPTLYAKTCELPDFKCDSLEKRVSGWFALIGMAGELATEYGITGWQEGEALNAVIVSFKLWRDFRGEGQTEDRQILSMISEFIDTHGSARFSSTENADDTLVRNRAGYWKDNNLGTRTYYFHSSGLTTAGQGFPIKRILNALDSAGWIAERDTGKRSKRMRIAGSSPKTFYAVRPVESTAL